MAGLPKLPIGTPSLPGQNPIDGGPIAGAPPLTPVTQPTAPPSSTFAPPQITVPVLPTSAPPFIRFDPGRLPTLPITGPAIPIIKPVITFIPPQGGLPLEPVLSPIGIVPISGTPTQLFENPSVNDLDLHMTTYNSVQFLSNALAPFDDHMTAAASSETDAYNAANDMANQSPDIAASVTTASSVNDNVGSDVFADGLAVLQLNSTGNQATLNQAGDSVNSANQPLEVLQQNPPPESTVPTTLADYEATVANWSSLPPEAQQQIAQQWCDQNVSAPGCGPFEPGGGT